MSLSEAVLLNDYPRVEKLLADGVNPSAADQYGTTPLHEAASRGRRALIQLLLDAGANPDAADWVDSTPLHAAVIYGNEKIVSLLLAAGANPNASNQHGSTPLHFAAYNSHKTIVSILLAAGADPTLRNKIDNTPAQVAMTPELRALLADAEYVWTHTWNPEEHARWTKAQRLERVGALSAFRTQTGRRIVIPELPRELQFAVFEHL